jgi:hypothetical protein
MHASSDAIEVESKVRGIGVAIGQSSNKELASKIAQLCSLLIPSFDAIAVQREEFEASFMHHDNDA